MVGIPLTDLEYLKKNLSLADMHKDMMHYMAKVIPPIFRHFLFFLSSFFLLFLCTQY